MAPSGGPSLPRRRRGSSLRDAVILEPFTGARTPMDADKPPRRPQAPPPAEEPPAQRPAGERADRPESSRPEPAPPSPAPGEAADLGPPPRWKTITDPPRV